jgi:hypothetical protein
MSYPLRLTPELERRARDRAASIGISFNAFVSVCVHAYLNQVPPGGSGGSKRSAKRPAAKSAQSPIAPAEETSWREFHDPDMWPYVDPEFQHRWQEVGGDDCDEATAVALELEYWSTRKRPQ